MYAEFGGLRRPLTEGKGQPPNERYQGRGHGTERFLRLPRAPFAWGGVRGPNGKYKLRDKSVRLRLVAK